MTSCCVLMPPSWGLVALLRETHAFTGWDDSETAFSTAAAAGNATDPEGKLWWGWWELGRSACPCPTADRPGQSLEGGGAGHRGGLHCSRGQLSAWHISFSRSRFGMPVSCLAPLPDHAEKRQSRGCQKPQTLSAGHVAVKGAGACAWVREAPKEEILKSCRSRQPEQCVKGFLGW